MDTVIVKIYGLTNIRILDRAEWLPELPRRRTYDELTPTEKKS